MSLWWPSTWWSCARPAEPPSAIDQQHSRADAAERELVQIRERVVELERDLGNERAVGDAKERELGVYRGKLARIRIILDE